jgi:hypothetical protein
MGRKDIYEDGKATQFKPGHNKSKGRPKGSLNMTSILKKYLSGTLNGNSLPSKDMVVLELIKKAIEGDVTAMKYIIDRVDGKPTEKRDINFNANFTEQSDKLKELLDDKE